MEKLLKALKANGLSVGEQEAGDLIVQKGWDAGNLSDDQIRELVGDLSGGIVVASSATPITKGRKNRKGKTPGPGEAISKVAAEASAEIAAFSGAIAQAQAGWVNHAADEILDGVADAPNQVVEALIQKAAGYQGDAEFFRGRGAEFASALFPSIPVG